MRANIFPVFTNSLIVYKEAIKNALRYLKLNSQQFLTQEGLKIYSPKFLAMLDNIEASDLLADLANGLDLKTRTVLNKLSNE